MEQIGQQLNDQLCVQQLKDRQDCFNQQNLLATLKPMTIEQNIGPLQWNPLETSMLMVTIRGLPYLKKVTLFDSCGKQIRIWINTYSLHNKPKGVIIANSLTNSVPLKKGLRMRFNDLCSEHKMKMEESYDGVKEFLTKEY